MFALFAKELFLDFFGALLLDVILALRARENREFEGTIFPSSCLTLSENDKPVAFLVVRLKAFLHCL